MFADWRIEPEEVERVAIIAKEIMGVKWEEALKQRRESDV